MSAKPSWFRRIFRGCFRAALWMALVLALATLFWLRGALYNHFVRFPRQQEAWQALRAQRQPVTTAPYNVWREYRGILHSHSHLSHDCEVPFEDILRVLKQTQLDFICLSDHCDEGRADFNVQWRGLREGKLFIPGFEMRDGFMPFGVNAGIVLSNRMDNATLARQVIEGGGVLFYAHPEEPRDWDLPELTGMEIYNLHTDFKRQRNPLSRMLPDILLNLKRYPDHLYHQQFHRPVEFLERWDTLNETRNLTGIAANDCHQNVGLRGIYTDQDTLRLEDTSPRTLREFHLNALSRPLLRLALGPLDPGRTLFRVQLDPYERSARFVNTHILSRGLNEKDILDALRHGRVFIGFDHLVDSTGFSWTARNAHGTAVTGESLPYSPETRLWAQSPVPCRFTFVKDGEPMNRQEGRAADWIAPAPGQYRIEAEVRVEDAWVPWVYTNPLRLTRAETTGFSLDTFDAASEATTPPGWDAGITGAGTPEWRTARDETAPSPARVLRQSGVVPKASFPLCLRASPVFRDGFVETRFKTVSGSVDQAAGIVFRAQGQADYYVCRANALEDNVVLYKVIRGTRSALDILGRQGGYGVETRVTPGEWHTLRVEFTGPRFRVFLDQKPLFESEDSSLADSGRAGLWTKADSVTVFDDFRCGPLPAP